MKTSKKENSQIELEAIRAAFRSAFSGPQGEMAWENLMVFCGLLSYNPGTDGVSLARAEGRRDVGIYIGMMIGHITTKKGERA